VRTRVGDFEVERCGRASRGLDLLDGLLGLGVMLAVGEDHADAALGGRDGGGLADSRAATGDECSPGHDFSPERRETFC
jgi:hypothetical protein